MMRETSILLMLLLGGCTAHTQETPVNASKILARDTVATLKTHYPPARTRLCVVGPPRDAFARELLTSLRQQGYAVAERCDGKTAPVSSRVMADSEHALVSVQVNNRRFARAFDTRTPAPSALGVWTSGEVSHARG